MKRSRLAIGIAFLILGTALAAIGQAPDESPAPEVAAITIDGSINPGSSDFIISTIEQALERNSLIELDTPGDWSNQRATSFRPC